MFHQNRLKTVTSRPELTDIQTYSHPVRHPDDIKIPYLVESETSLAQSITDLRQSSDVVVFLTKCFF